MDILDINGDDIRKFREKMGWTRAKLSELSGVPDRTIQDIETGKSKNPGLYTIKSLLEVMPSYPDARKNDLIIAIHARLTTLDYGELLTVNAAIDSLPSNPIPNSKTTITD